MRKIPTIPPRFWKNYGRFLTFRDIDHSYLPHYRSLTLFLGSYLGTLLDISTGLIIFAPLFTIFAFGITYVFLFILRSRYHKEWSKLEEIQFEQGKKRTSLYKNPLSTPLLLLYIPLTICSINVVVEVEDLVRDIRTNYQVRIMEEKIDSYSILGECTIPEFDGVVVTFFQDSAGEEFISKLSCNTVARYRTYEKVSYEDFWYFVNYTNYLYKTEPDRNLAHLEHENLHSNSYSILNGVELVTVPLAHKETVTSFDFIVYEGNYYMGTCGGGYSSNNSQQYKNLVSQFYQNGDLFTTNFFQDFPFKYTMDLKFYEIPRYESPQLERLEINYFSDSPLILLD